MDNDDVRKKVREGYAGIARKSRPCCCGPGSVPDSETREDEIGKGIGYSSEELGSVPSGANLGLGCGNPTAMASLRKGETVLDLGSGPGLDCFLAANLVGKEGRIIGVDMTPEMIERARENARSGGYENVEFRLGEIENIPAADRSVDIVISNCVINLSPDKKRVFEEAFRVLKPGGRLMVSDIVVLKELPEEVRNSMAAYVSCIAGALMKEDYLGAMEAAGFRQVEVLEEKSFPVECVVSDSVVSAFIEKNREGIGESGDFVVSITVRAIRKS